MTAAPTDDPLRATIERMVERFAVGRLTREDLVASIVIAAAETRLDRTTAEQARAESARLLGLWQAAGADRYAAGKVAAKLTSCPTERRNIAQRIRDLNRKRK